MRRSHAVADRNRHQEFERYPIPNHEEDPGGAWFAGRNRRGVLDSFGSRDSDWHHWLYR